MVLAYIGDALWVLSLAIMFGASRQAWANSRPGVPVRLPFGQAPRGLAIWALPGAAFAFSLWLALQARQQSGDEAVIVFGVRATTAALLALLHLRWIASALRGGPDA